MIRSRGKILSVSVILALATAAVIARRLPADDAQTISPQVESSVDRGLAWLAKTQGPDGSWETNGGAGGGAGAAATGLAAMAFMARGHVPGEGPYGDNLNHAFDAIMSMQQSDGVIAQNRQSEVMYDHGICTVAMCEGYGMLDDRRQNKAREVISKAVRLILNAQKVLKPAGEQGGWRYTPEMASSDTSVTGWQLMALRGAKNTGAFLPQEAIDNGIAYIKRRATIDGEPVPAHEQGSSGANAAMTGTGVLALSLMGQPDSPEVKAGGDFLLRNDPTAGNHYFYSVYYCSQAAWQLGGTYWTTLNQRISNSLRSKQTPAGNWTGGEGGDAVCTSMAILALTVPYRYLPIYQR